jgi:hypothetical protein
VITEYLNGYLYDVKFFQFVRGSVITVWDSESTYPIHVTLTYAFLMFPGICRWFFYSVSQFCRFGDCSRLLCQGNISEKQGYLLLCKGWLKLDVC